MKSLPVGILFTRHEKGGIVEEDPRDPRATEATEGSDPMVDVGGGSGDLEDVGAAEDQPDAGYQERAEDEGEPAP